MYRCNTLARWTVKCPPARTECTLPRGQSPRGAAKGGSRAAACRAGGRPLLGSSHPRVCALATSAKKHRASASSCVRREAQCCGECWTGAGGRGKGNEGRGLPFSRIRRTGEAKVLKRSPHATLVCITAAAPSLACTRWKERPATQLSRHHRGPHHEPRQPPAPLVSHPRSARSRPEACARSPSSP